MLLWFLWKFIMCIELKHAEGLHCSIRHMERICPIDFPGFVRSVNTILFNCKHTAPSLIQAICVWSLAHSKILDVAFKESIIHLLKVNRQKFVSLDLQQVFVYSHSVAVFFESHNSFLWQSHIIMKICSIILFWHNRTFLPTYYNSRFENIKTFDKQVLTIELQIFVFSELFYFLTHCIFDHWVKPKFDKFPAVFWISELFKELFEIAEHFPLCRSMIMLDCLSHLLH